MEAKLQWLLMAALAGLDQQRRGPAESGLTRFLEDQLQLRLLAGLHTPPNHGSISPL